MTDRDTTPSRQRDIVDQSTETRDPADDSGEADDPTALVEDYPKAFDGQIAEAEAAIADENAPRH